MSLASDPSLTVCQLACVHDRSSGNCPGNLLDIVCKESGSETLEFDAFG